MATRSRTFFVMEYVKSGELFAKVAKGKLKEETARKYFQQLISVVNFCHNRVVSRRGSMFTSKCSTTAIMERMEGFGKGINFRVGKVKDFKMSLTGEQKGRNGG
ncbi:unnamed protein product [Linum trigynum]|uniref:Protein kinase domain-containing protein n=1 Tax=Linum trigynum TaxID=586398 RepID=A0AAV2GC88_9ROSI